MYIFWNIYTFETSSFYSHGQQKKKGEVYHYVYYGGSGGAGNHRSTG
jgi:hypothetical protein